MPKAILFAKFNVFLETLLCPPCAMRYVSLPALKSKYINLTANLRSYIVVFTQLHYLIALVTS